jgi:hypothetical protein
VLLSTLAPECCWVRTQQCLAFIIQHCSHRCRCHSIALLLPALMHPRCSPPIPPAPMMLAQYSKPALAAPTSPHTHPDHSSTSKLEPPPAQPSHQRTTALPHTGPGVGKGRQIAAAVMHYFCSGKTKAVWISACGDLAQDAARDLRDVGAMQYSAMKLHDLKKLKLRPGQKLADLPGWVGLGL